MREIFEKFEFENEIEKLDETNRLFEVIKEFASIDLHPERVPNLVMGYVFENLIRRFNEQANEEAGDHFTPREVTRRAEDKEIALSKLVDKLNDRFGTDFKQADQLCPDSV